LQQWKKQLRSVPEDFSEENELFESGFQIFEKEVKSALNDKK